MQIWLISRDSHQVSANWANFAIFAVRSWCTLKEQGLGEFSDNHVDFASFAVVNFAQFAVIFEVSISCGPNREMVGEFRVICRNGGNFESFGGIQGFLVYS